MSASKKYPLKIPLGSSFLARTTCRMRNNLKLGRYLLNSVFHIRMTLMITVGKIFVLRFFVLQKHFKSQKNCDKTIHGANFFFLVIFSRKKTKRLN